MNEKQLRELDSWIAEHAMGWRDFKVGIYGAGAPEREPSIHGTPPTRKSGVFSVPNYTTDRAAAMAVLEKCSAFDQKVKVCIQQDSPSDWRVCRLYWQDYRPIEDWYSHAETLPLAICIFAKKLFSEPRTEKGDTCKANPKS